MTKFRIMPHGRLQEWVAEEKGYYAEEGLEYEFVRPAAVGRQAMPAGSVQSADSAPAPVMNGAFESMESGRACDVSSACHWAVNMASSAEHGIMWGHAYSVTPAGVYVAHDSPIRSPEQLRDVEVGVGYHSGSHFSALQEISLRRVAPANNVHFGSVKAVPSFDCFDIPAEFLKTSGLYLLGAFHDLPIRNPRSAIDLLAPSLAFSFDLLPRQTEDLIALILQP